MSALNMSDWEKRGLQAMVSEDDAWKAHYDVTIERQGKKFRGFAKRSNGAVERFDSLRAWRRAKRLRASR